MGQNRRIDGGKNHRKCKQTANGGNREYDQAKDEAMALIGGFQVLPRLVVFDLDYTLWPLYCELRSKCEMPSCYPHVKGILRALKDKGIDVAIASRSAAANVANIFLDKLEISSMFIVKEIFTSWTHKTDHFHRINQSTGVPYNEMLFFDDDEEIIETISMIGVTSILVNEGVTLAAFEEGLLKFSQNFASLERNKQLGLKKNSKASSSSEDK